jgi:ABC-type glycerol-3-phosphate transport system substrate-binding protein
MANRTLSRREFLQLAAVTSAGTALAACAPAATPTAEPAAPTEAPPEPTEAPAAPVEKKVELWSNSGGGFGDRLDEFLEEIREGSGLHIEVARGSGGWKGQMERVNAALAAGSVPGLAHLKDFRAWDYAWRGAVTPLDDYYATGALDTDAFRPSMWDAMKYRDSAVGIPFRGSFVWVLFINDIMFKEAGLDPEADAPTTWDELVDVSTKLTDESAGKYGHTFYEWGTREVSTMLFSTYVGQVGGRIFAEDMSAVTLDTPEAEQAMQWIVDMMHTWKVALPPEEMPNRYELAYNNLIGTVHTGLWYVGQVEENAPQTEWSITKVPCLNTCDNADTPECLVIFKGAEDPDTAWEAAEALTKPEYDVDLSAAIGGLPIYQSSLGKGVWAEDPTFVKYAEIGRDPDLRPRQWVEGYEEVSAAILPDLEAVWFGQKDVKEGLVAAEKAGNEALKEAQA